MTDLVRCPWPGDDPLMLDYHDTEWGTPVRDDPEHFEFLILEGAQAGLSWSTVLRKREGYREAFAGFDPAAVARFTPHRVETLLQNPAIIRNRQKVEATIGNAAAFLAVQDEFGSFDTYFWGWSDGDPIQNRWETLDEIPSQTPLSESLSKDLRQRGFRFVGPTIMYAHMQAVGMVNDHIVSCFRWSEVQDQGH